MVIFICLIAVIHLHTLRRKMGVNKFTDMTESELKFSRGGNKNALASSKVSQHVTSNLDISSLPKSVDWRDQGVVTTVKDQVGCITDITLM